MNSNNKITFVSEKLKNLTNFKLTKEQIKIGTCTIVASLIFLNSTGNIKIASPITKSNSPMIAEEVAIAVSDTNIGIEAMVELLDYSNESLELEPRSRKESVVDEEYTIQFTSQTNEKISLTESLIKRLMAHPKIAAIMKTKNLTEFQLAFVIASILDNNRNIYSIENIDALLNDERIAYDLEQNFKDATTLEEKLSYIYRHYNVTPDQFNIVAATILHEGGPKNYNEGYSIASLYLNRMSSILWCRSAANYFEDTQNIYNLTIMPNQFTSYLSGEYHQFYDENGIYHEYLGSDNPEWTYMGIVDCLYYGIPSHNYTEFRSAPEDNGAKWECLNGANWFTRIMPASDKIEEIETEATVLDDSLTEYSTIKQYTITYH